MFFMEPPEFCGPGRGGRISGPIQRTYTWRGLASYVEAGNGPDKNRVNIGMALFGPVKIGNRPETAGQRWILVD
jgi:hypothetical protein